MLCTVIFVIGFGLVLWGVGGGAAIGATPPIIVNRGMEKLTTSRRLFRQFFT